MNKVKYLLQFIFILLFLLIFRLLGLNISRYLSGKILSFLGPFFRSNIITLNNINQAFPEKDGNSKKKIVNEMWMTYGKILSEYIFIKHFRTQVSNKVFEIEGQSILDQIKNSKEPVVFVSGHFDNFELMAMHIEKSGIDLAAVYRPLNNPFLNIIMEHIRKKYICSKQIKKGISGTKDLLKYFKSGTSIALMIDQRVSEGIRCKLFGKDALTTTIPAQFVKKFNCKIVPVHIERKINENFKIKIFKPLNFSENETIENITLSLNSILEKMINIKPSQWIWTHSRWK